MKGGGFIAKPNGAEPIKTERISLHLPKKTIQTLKRLAAKNGTDLSKEIRRAIDGYLDIELNAENLDMINGVIKQELSPQTKALGNRLASLIDRLLFRLPDIMLISLSFPI